MANYTYVVEYKHGSAQGEVQAESDQEAKDKAKAMYHGLKYDTVSAKGKPYAAETEVTNVTVTKVKE